MHALSLSFLRGRRLTLEVRQRIGWVPRVAIIIGAVLFGLGICVAILVSRNVDVASIYDEFIVFTFLNSQGISTVVVHSTPLVMVGLAASMAFRVNYWNIGIEGQLFMGAIGCTIVAFFDIGPEIIRLPLMFIFAIFFGALWALPSALLKLRLNINEVISTLLLNYIAFYFVLNQVFGPWRDPKDNFPHSPAYDDFERLPKIGWEDVHYGIVGTALAFLVVWWLVERSRFGIQSRFVGVNPRMVYAIGLPLSAITLTSALSSGALAGMAGFTIAAATEGRLTFHLAVGYGFSGIVIAFLSGNRPMIVLIVSFLMGGLYVAGESMKVFYSLPDALVGLFQAVIVLSVTASEFFARYRLRMAHYEQV